MKENGWNLANPSDVTEPVVFAGCEHWADVQWCLNEMGTGTIIFLMTVWLLTLNSRSESLHVCQGLWDMLALLIGIF